MEKTYDRIFRLAAALAAVATLALSCRHNPLDDYSRIPPDRSGESGEDAGGMGGAFASGYGTYESPYVLATADHVKNMSKALAPEEMIYFRLSADIDMEGVAWTPLNNADPYSLFIDFDGDGHVIKNFRCTGQSYSSFFGILCGECRNVGFVDAEVSGGNASGIIAGYLGVRSPSSTNYVGTVTGCYVSGTVSGVPAGGIAGYMGTAYTPYACTVSGSYSAAEVTSTGPAGGIAGELLNGAEINGAYATGKISSSGACGGIAGNLQGSSYLTNVVAWNSSVYGAAGKTGVISGSGQSFAGASFWEKTLSSAPGTGGKSSEQLRTEIVGWGSPWASDGSAANGYPAPEWLAKRTDIAEICGNLAPAEDPDTPPVAEKIEEGSGTEDSPYIVRTAGHLLYLPEVMEEGKTVRVRLADDIDLKNAVWTPLNGKEPYICGIRFDGGGHKISNLSCAGAGVSGFFGVLNGTCTDVEFQGAFVSGLDTDCGLLGSRAGTDEGPVSTVSGVTVSGTVSNGASGELHTGGLFGTAVNTEFMNCSLDMDVTSGVVAGNSRAACGGIVGKSGSGVTVSGCTVGGKVTNTSGKYTGGIIGWESGGDVKVDGCEVKAYIKSSLERTGGVAGHLQGGEISGCVFSGEIETANQYAGGIAGIASSSSTFRSCRVSGKISGKNNCGGILGNNENAVTVENCVFTGSLTADQRIGGIVGDLGKGGSVRNCLVSGAVTGWAGVGGIVGRAAAGAWNSGADCGNTVESCIVYTGTVTATRADENGGSSGAIVGFTSVKNILRNCWRKAGMTLTANYCSEVYDQDDTDGSTLLKVNPVPAEYTYIFPYHGKAAAAGATASDIARSLGWDSAVWDLTSSMPALK